MDEFYFSTSVGNDVTLCISPLTERYALAAGLAEGETGYFLYERTQSGGSQDIAVIARLHSEDAALRLSKMLGME
jgi:hypothetical protein